MKKLPIGIQDFKKLREEGFLYIDKTEYLYQLATQGVYYFLSRPRRFGKSLLVSTLAELFKGNQDLFKGLWIEDQWDWTQPHPVIVMNFNQGTHKVVGLEAFLYEELKRQAKSYEIELADESYPSQFRDLIEQLHQKHGRVVVLIDEYDKPILDYLEDTPKAEANREILKNFYSILKPLDPHLRFVLLTGVSKFSRVSIFSELNNLNDLSIHNRYSTMLGYTQEELEEHFADRIDALAPNFGGREAFLAKIKEWYNGYSWDAQNFVYNPFSILSFFDKMNFENFWFETGTPTFLVKLLNREQQYNLENIQATPLAFSSFELNYIDPLALLFQTGYITITAKEEDMTYTLSYPNKEVRHSLLQYLLASYSHEYPSRIAIRAKQMKDALKNESLKDFAEALNSLFACIPYQIFIAKKEAYYHSVTFLALSLMGSFMEVEVSQARGKPDTVVFAEEIIYVMEFKLDKGAEEALDQIKKKEYFKPYLNLEKRLKLVGLNFSSEQKAVDAWVEEEL